MKKGAKTFLFILNLILGIYLINSVFVFRVLPESFAKINNSLIVVSGLLMIITGFLILRLRRYSY